MAGSSPAARLSQHLLDSPNQHRRSDYLSEYRNTELSHHDALVAAQAEHERVRVSAIRAYNIHELQEESRRLRDEQRSLQEQQRKEQERVRLEESLRAEELRLRELRAQHVPQLPPESPAPRPPAEGTASQRPSAAQAAQPAGGDAGKTAQTKTPAQNNKTSAPTQANGLAQQPNQHSPKAPLAAGGVQPSPFAQEPPKPSPFSNAAASQTNGAVASPPNSSASAQPAPQTNGKPTPDRYVEIHQNLKKLRASLDKQAKTNPRLKSRMGDMRRELRKSLGQLIGEKGKNKQQVQSVQNLLKEALSGQVPSELLDPSVFVTDTREPVEGALHNEPQLPSLFLYLLNHLAKAIINQFINECGASPKSAEPIGVLTAQIFSSKEFSWRGRSLVDILMAKFRVVCPVVFGYRGSEKTEQGRTRLGWRREGSGWIAEQQHIDRMMGLGVGYASIALRDFSKSQNANPWPPSRYWTAMANIVNTPPAEISNTQCVVLRSMVELYEDKFLNFYGSAGVAALRKALVEFPAKAQVETPGVAGLKVLAQIFKRDYGLQL